jgi:hypothetical protein
VHQKHPHSRPSTLLIYEFTIVERINGNRQLLELLFLCLLRSRLGARWLHRFRRIEIFVNGVENVE